MAKQYFIPGDGMVQDNDLMEYFIPGDGMINQKSVTGGFTIADMEVAIEMDNLTITFAGGVAKWSMFLVM